MNIQRRILVSEFLSETIPIYALIPVMFANFGNLSTLQVGSLLAIWQVLITIFEIPTGVVADKFGRSTSLTLGKLLRVVCYPIWLLYPSFTGFLAGIVFLAIGDALISGALEAYSYDEVKNKKSFNILRQRTVAIHLLAFTSAGAISFALGANYRQILILSALMAFVGFVASFMLPKDTSHHGLSTKHVLVKSMKEIVLGKGVFRVFATATIVLTAMVVFIEQLTIFYSDTGIADKTVALIIAGGNLVSFILFWVTPKIERLLRSTLARALCVLSLALVATIVLKQSILLQISAIFILVRLLRLAQIHYSNDLHHVVSSATRATMGSISSFVAKIFTALSIFVIGYIANTTSDIRLPLAIFGVIFVIGIMLFGSKSLRRTHIAQI